MHRNIAISMLLFSNCSTAATVTIDFESLYQAEQDSESSNYHHGNLYTEDGMQVRDVDGEYQLSTWTEEHAGFNGSTAMFNNSRNATNELAAKSGGSFDLVSIDLSPLHISFNTLPEVNPDDHVYVTFVTNTGHSQTFDVGITDGNWVYDDFWEAWYTDTPPPVTTFLFDTGFVGITSVTWIQNDPGPHQFDNIVATNIVPIPAAVWLFGSALAGLGWMRRRPTV
jgi:hypothetical protein